MGWGLGSGPTQPEKALAAGRGVGWRGTTHSSMGQALYLGPAGKGRGSTWKGEPLECGVPEFGSKALGEGVWVGFRPSALEGVSEGVSECRGRALGGGAGAGLGF